MKVFLTSRDLENLSKWKYSVEDKSITTEYFSPFWEYLASLMPSSVAPNVISLVGLLCTMYSYYLCYHYLDSYPVLTPILSASLVFIYFNLDAVDGKHARKTRNSSPLGELFDHACDNITMVFLVMGATRVLGITNPINQWMIVQSGLLIFMMSHLEAFQKGVVEFGRYSGPGEVLMFNIGIILLRSVTDYSWLHAFCDWFFGDSKIFSSVYYLIFIYTVFKIAFLPNHYETRNGLLISLGIHFVFSMLYVNAKTLDLHTILGNALVMTILASDLIVAKMAKRQLHPFVPVFLLVSFAHSLLAIILCAVYHVVVLCEISYHLQIPLLHVRYNVFVNGVYDLLHEGHMNLFEKASSYGTKLIVGVHNDIDVETYKRKPYMTHDERCRAVSWCKYAEQVVPNCPLVLTKEFIEEYSINVVCCSTEYDSPDDKYYRAARELGILKVLPRTEGISTSNLIKRIRTIQKEEILEKLPGFGAISIPDLMDKIKELK